MKMENTREISRQEFLKYILQYVVQNVRLFFRGRSNFPDGDEAEKGEDALFDNTTVKGVQLEAERCLAWGGGACQFCYLACPLRDKAITLDDQRPTINISFCDGCGQCLTACQTVNDRPAIKIVYKS